MALPFPEYLDLLELHGRNAVHNLGRLSPEAEVPPPPLSARATAEDHWGTLEYWAWSLENPSASFSEYPERTLPEEYSQLVAAIPTELGRLARSLSSSGPDAPIEYFDRPGTVAEVARLLACEAIVAARSAGLAAGGGRHCRSPRRPRAMPSTMRSGIGSRKTPASNAKRILSRSCARTQGTSGTAVFVSGVAQNLLWWLHGYTTPEGSVTLSGDRSTIRDLWAKLCLQETSRRLVAAGSGDRRWFW